MTVRILLTFFLVTVLGACSSSSCDANEAQNKLLAIGKLQGRLLTQGGEGIEAFANSLTQETGPIYELVAQQKYNEACKQIALLEEKYKLDLKKEQEGMLTIEQLAADGGKGTGTCSIADAAKKQMELHGKIQAAVDAGKKDSSLFAMFNEDTSSVAEFLSTDPSRACALFEQLQKKYDL